MKRVIIFSMLVILAGCISSTNEKYVNVPGHAYKTDPNCKRTKPPSQFDERCDCPRAGFKGFSPSQPCDYM